MRNEPFAPVAVTSGALSVIKDRYSYLAVSQMTEPDLQTYFLWWWLKRKAKGDWIFLWLARLLRKKVRIVIGKEDNRLNKER